MLAYLNFDGSDISGTTDGANRNLTLLQQSHDIIGTADNMSVSRLVRHKPKIHRLPQRDNLNVDMHD